MTSTPDPIDSDQLKALAHPIRVTLLGLLRRDGAGTSSTLAATMKISSGLASYHLRALAAAQFVVEDTERGTGRERWWRAADESTNVMTGRIRSDASDALSVLQRQWDRRRDDLEDAWARDAATWPEQWHHVRDRSDWLLRLTPDESREVVVALIEAMRPFQELSIARRDGAEIAPDDARFVAAFATLVPVADGIVSEGG